MFHIADLALIISGGSGSDNADFTVEAFLRTSSHCLDTMSLHWTIIAGFLYAEIAAILLLLLPFLSNKTWNKLFRSRFLLGLQGQLIYYFYVLVAILILFFLGKLFNIVNICVIKSPWMTVEVDFRCYTGDEEVQR